MKRIAFLGLLAGCLLAANSSGGPVQPQPPTSVIVDTYGELAFPVTFEGGKYAAAIAIGNGRTYMGMYLFDRWGNCLVRDDISSKSKTSDDLAVTWLPSETAPYDVHIVNFGADPNKAKLAIR